MQAYLEGKIKDRDDTILFLVDELKLNVTRITNKGISILPEGKNRPVRLKGEMYERDFSINRADSEEEARRTDSYRERISRDITAVKAEYSDRIESKRTALAERYRSIEQTHSAESRFVATTTYRADQSIQQLYETAINKSSRRTWSIDDSFDGYKFDAIYLEWQSSQSNRKNATVLKQQQIAIENNHFKRQPR